MPTPSWINRAVAVLAIAGLAVSAYLTLVHMMKLNLICSFSFFDCGRVAVHPLSHGFGLPVLDRYPTAVYGALLYAVVAGVSLLRAAVSDRFADRVRQLQFLLVGVGFLVSLGLSYAEGAIIHAWCLWCLISAGIITLMTVLLLWERRALRGQTPPVASNRWREAGLTFCLQLVAVLAAGGLLWAARSLQPQPERATYFTRAMLVPPGAPLQGAPQAPYTLVELGSYQCPHCAQSVPTLDRILERHADRLNFLFIPVANKYDAGFLEATMAVEAARRQGQYWAMHHTVFAHQAALLNPGNNPRTQMLALAQQLKLDRSRFTRDLDDLQARQTVIARSREIRAKRIAGLPNYVFFAPGKPTMLLRGTEQMERWLAEPKHW